MHNLIGITPQEYRERLKEDIAYDRRRLASCHLEPNSCVTCNALSRNIAKNESQLLIPDSDFRIEVTDYQLMVAI